MSTVAGRRPCSFFQWFGWRVVNRNPWFFGLLRGVGVGWIPLWLAREVVCLGYQGMGMGMGFVGVWFGYRHRSL